MRAALFAAIGFAVFLAPVAHAQDAVRVVRLSLAEGQVLVSHPGTNVWEEAPANLPLVEGDTLATQDGRAAFEGQRAEWTLFETAVRQILGEMA